MRTFAVFLFLKKQILMQLQNHLCLFPLFLILW